MSSEIRETTYIGAALGALALASVTLATAPALAAPPPWAGKPYAYMVVDQDVRGVLTEFGRNVGVPVVLTDKVRGRVRGAVREKNAEAFLKRVVDGQDLTWYFDGSALHVSADEEFSTQVIDAGVDGQSLARELDRLGLSDARFAVRATGKTSVVGVSGPPAFQNVVRQTAGRMKPPPRVAGDDPRVRVFRGGAKDEVVRTQAAARPASPDPDAAGGEAGRTP